MPPRSRARELQVRDIRTRNEEHEPDDDEYSDQWLFVSRAQPRNARAGRQDREHIFQEFVLHERRQRRRTRRLTNLRL